MEIHVNQIEKRSWVEIDLSQIKRNYLLFKEAVRKDVQIMAVIKADAYGHGDVQVARMLYDCGCHMFAVSNIDEAIGLREAGIKGEILILGYSSPFYANSLLRYDLTQTLVSEEYAEALAATKLKIKCQFAIDTGMNRIGLDANNPKQCESIIRKYASSLNLCGLFTHLCVADTEDKESHDFTHCQISKFQTIVNSVNDLSLPYIHCFNSAGALYYLKNNDGLYKGIDKIVRLGIVLYGLKPDRSNILPQGIYPPLTWKSAISQVKVVKPGETIGYGRTYKVKSERKIATLTTGYADGFSRLLSNKGFVIIKGKTAPIVGRICMDQTLVDVTGIEGVKMGDQAILIGRSGGISYTADDMAADIGTIGYEVLVTIAKRVQRFYIYSNQML